MSKDIGMGIRKSIVRLLFGDFIPICLFIFLMFLWLVLVVFFGGGGGGHKFGCALHLVAT